MRWDNHVLQFPSNNTKNGTPTSENMWCSLIPVSFHTSHWSHARRCCDSKSRTHIPTKLGKLLRYWQKHRVVTLGNIVSSRHSRRSLATPQTPSLDPSRLFTSPYSFLLMGLQVYRRKKNSTTRYCAIVVVSNQLQQANVSSDLT